jgi:hypothetical protein
MFITSTELREHFEALGYTVEISGQFVAFHKNGNYVTLLPNNIIGTVESIQNEVENRFAAAAEYTNAE